MRSPACWRIASTTVSAVWPDGERADAPREVDEDVAVEVLDQRAVGAADADGVGLGEPGGDGRRPARVQGQASRPGDLGSKLDVGHGGDLTSGPRGDSIAREHGR